MVGGAIKQTEHDITRGSDVDLLLDFLCQSCALKLGIYRTSLRFCGQIFHWLPMFLTKNFSAILERFVLVDQPVTKIQQCFVFQR